MMTIRTIVFGCTLGVLATPILLAQSDSFDTGSFEQSSEEDKQAFVLAVLQNRESQLQNFSYEMTESVSRFTPNDGKRQFLREVSMAVKRKGEQLFLYGEKLDSKKRLKKFTANWDGKRARTLLHRPYHETAPYTGNITDLEDTNFKYRAYNQMLGLRILGHTPMTLVEWFEDTVSKGQSIEDQSIEIDIVEEDGKSVLVLKVTVGYKYWQWSLDVERDYMPIRMEILYKRGEDYNSDLSVVEDAIKVDGFWVPKKVFRKTGTSVSDGQPEYTYEVSTFSRNTVTDEDMKIEFPPGTEVADALAKVAYRVLPGDRAEMMSLYDPATGEVIEPVSSHPADVVGGLPGLTKGADANKGAGENVEAEEPNASAGSQAVSKAPPTVAETSTGGRRLWRSIAAIGIGVLLVVLGAGLLAARRRERAARSNV